MLSSSTSHCSSSLGFMMISYIFISSVFCFTCSFSISDNDPTFVCSKGAEVLTINSETKNVTKLFKTSRIISDLDFYYPKQKPDKPLIFFIDVYGSEIFKASQASNKWLITSIISNELRFVSRIKVDWINKHLYWVDSKLNAIGVTNFNGIHASYIFFSNCDITHVDVDPVNRLLFWGEKNQTHNFLKKSSLDGSSVVEILVTKSSNSDPIINAFDDENKVFYWMSNSSVISSSQYDGSEKKYVIDNNIEVDSMSYFDDGLFLLTSTSVFYVKISENEIDVTSVINKTSDIHVHEIYSNQKQPPSLHINPCDIKNGGCSHFCFPNQLHVVHCLCPFGLSLTKNRKDCADVNETVLVSDEANRMMYVSSMLYPSRMIFPPFDLPRYSGKLSFDSYYGNTFWTSEHLGELRVTTDFHESVEILDLGDTRPVALSIDKSTGNIYLASMNSKLQYNTYGPAISVCSSNGASYMSIITSNIYRPRFLTTVPKFGKLYFIDAQEHVSLIKLSRMDGSDQISLYKTTANITAFTVNMDSNDVFWAEKLNNSNYTTSVIKSRNPFGVIKMFKMIHHDISSMLISSSHLNVYFIKNRQNYLTKISLSTDSNEHFETFAYHSLISNVVHNSSKVNSSCSKNTCGSLCIPISSTEHKCPPLSGFSNFLFFTKNSQKFSITGFTLESEDVSKFPAFPLGHLASWISYSAYHAATGTIFWVDKFSESIKSSRIDNTNLKTLKSSVADVGGLVFDWIANNLYWTETSKGTINVMRVNGSFPNVLIYKISKPSAIAIDPVIGNLFWVETLNGVSYIKVSNLAGENVQTLIESLHPIKSIKVDPFTSSLYWLSDAKLIKMEINGDNYNSIEASDLIFSPESFAFNENYFFWIDKQHAGSIMRIPKLKLFNNSFNSYSNEKQADGVDISEANGIKIMAYNLGNTLTSIHYFSPKNQQGKNPCAENNGGCDQLCLFERNDTYSCQCTFSILGPDNHSCIDHDNYLMFSFGSKLFSIDLRDEDNPNSPIEPFSMMNHKAEKHHPENILFNPDFNGFIFTDYLHKSSIFLLQNDTVLKLTDFGRSAIKGISYSSSLNLIVWTQLFPSALGYIQYDNRQNDWLRNLHLIKLEGYQPSAIALDDCARIMFLVNKKAGVHEINKLHLGDKAVVPFVKSSKIISSLVIDKVNRLLYWTEHESKAPHLMKIMSYHLDFYNFEEVFTGFGYGPQTLVYADKNLYWSDWFRSGIMRYDLDTGNVTIMNENFRKINGLAVVYNLDLSSNCTVFKLKSMLTTLTTKPFDNLTHDNLKNTNSGTFDRKEKKSSAEFNILLISLPGIMLAAIFFSLLTILVVRKYACCQMHKARISYLSYNESLPRGLCSSQNIYTNPVEQPACLYDMEMVCVNQQYEKFNRDKESLIESC